MNNKEKKVLRFHDNDSIIPSEDRGITPFNEITLRSSIGSPIATSSVARPLLPQGHRDEDDLGNSHIMFSQMGQEPPDSARSRVSVAPSDMTDTSLGILNLDDLASGLEVLDDDFMDMFHDLNSPRSGIGDGEEMAAAPQPSFTSSQPSLSLPQPSLPSPSPADSSRSFLRASQMSAQPSIMFMNSQEDEEEDDGIGSEFSDPQATPVPGQVFWPRKQGNDGARSSEIDTEDELAAARQEISKTRSYVPDPADRLGVGESRDSDGDDKSSRHFDGSRDGSQVPRLQLDGGSSEDDHQPPPLSEPRQSAEGEVVILDPGDGGGGGDGMSDGETTSSGLPDAPVSFGQSTLMALQGQGANRSSRDWTLTSGAVDRPALARDAPDEDADDEDDEDDNQAPHMEVFAGQPRIQPVGETDIWAQGAGSMNFSDRMSLPHNSSTAFQKRFSDDLLEQNNGNFGNNPFDSGPLPDQNGLPLNELGYGSGDEFVAADDALAMLNKDQEEFEQENIFRQDEDMSRDVGDDHQSGWELPNGNHMTLRDSLAKSTSVAWDDEKSYNHSMEKMFAMRSEALGSLSGDSQVVKPHFGDGTVLSPPSHPPHPLINQSLILSNHDNDASLREFKFEKDAHDPSRFLFHDQSQPADGMEASTESQSISSKERFRAHENQGNRSGVYVPSGKLQFQVGKKNRMEDTTEQAKQVDRSVTDSLLDEPDGYQTPPMDLSVLTAAIAQASSTADPQQLARMILNAQGQLAAAKEEAKQKAAREAVSKSRSSHELGQSKKMAQSDIASKPKLSTGRRPYSINQGEKKPLRSPVNGRSSYDYRFSTENGELFTERTSLEGSGGSGQESRSSSLSHGSQDRDNLLDKKGVFSSEEKCNSDHSELYDDYTERESKLGADYFAEITRDRLPTRGTDISDTIDFQDFEDDDGFRRSHSYVSNAQTVQSSQERLQDENYSEIKRSLGSTGNVNQNPKELNRNSRDAENTRHPQIYSGLRQSNVIGKNVDPRQDIRNLQPKGNEVMYHSSNRTVHAMKENIAPQKTKSVPVLSKHRRSRDSAEISQSHDKFSHQHITSGTVEGSDRESIYSVPRRKGNGQYQESRKMVEPRSQAIPDGEPTEAESVVTPRVPALLKQDVGEQVTLLSLNQQRPKSQPTNDGSSSVMQRDSNEGLPCRPQKPSQKLPSRPRRTIDGASFGKNDHQMPLRDDDVFKRPQVPIAPRSTKGDSANMHGMMSKKAPHVPNANFVREEDPSRFSIDSQAEINVGKHRIVPTQRHRRTENDMERTSGDDNAFQRPNVPAAPLNARSDSMNIPLTLSKGSHLSNEELMEKDTSRFSIDSHADINIGKHRIVQTPRQVRVENTPLEGRDAVFDADVDSGFSSEHPHRMSNSSGVPQLTVSNVAQVQEMWKKTRELNMHFNDERERSPKFSVINASMLSPNQSPVQSPQVSPVAPAKHNTSGGSEADKTLQSSNRTLLAGTPDLISPRSSGSSQSHGTPSSMNRSSSTSSERSCSTPKRSPKPDSETVYSGVEKPPPSFASTQSLLPPPYQQPQSKSASTLSSIPDASRRPVLPSYMEQQPSFYRNQALSETNFLQHYVNDRAVSSLPIHGMHEPSLPQRSASHLGIPMVSHQPGVYLGHTAPITSNLYRPPQSMAMTGSIAPSLQTAPYTSQLAGHHQQQQTRRLHHRSRSVERSNPMPWPAYHMQDAQTNGVAGLLQTAVHPGANVPTPPLGHPNDSVQGAIVSSLIVPFGNRFRDVACIGIEAQDFIQLQNPSSRWLQCFLEVVSLSVNGEEVDHSSRIFFMRPRIIIGPYTTEEYKITFAPRQPGLHEAKIQVGSSPVVAESETSLLKVTAPQMMTLRAVAELPEIEIDGVEKGRLELGEMVFGKERSKTLSLINRGRSSLPVRLFFVNKMAAVWYTVSVTAENGQDHCTSAAPSRPLHITLPGHSTTTIDGEVARPPSSITIKLTTQRSEAHLRAASLGPPEDVRLSLKVELDVPERSVSLADVDICARVGVAKLHMSESLVQEAFVLKSSIGQTASRNLLIKNAGNIRLDMRLSVPKGIDSFEVVPDKLVLQPSQQRDILVRFTPTEQMGVVEVPLFIHGKPDGPDYEIHLHGEIRTPQQNVRIKSSAEVLCNKQYIAWGGVPLGMFVKKSAVLRNPDTKIVSLKLAIRDSEEFQLQISHGSQKTSSSRQVVIKPKQDFPVDIIYKPSHLSSAKGTLDIKPANGSTKYLIPLSGYGGVSNLILEDANLRGDTYLQDMGSLTPGQHSVLTFKVRNTGLRAAFVKALCFRDSRANVKLPGSHLNVEPGEFVISPKMSKTLTVIFNPKEGDVLSGTDSLEVAAVGLYYGDEILRQLLKRIPPSEIASRQKSLPSDNPLRGVSFDVKYMGEEYCNEKFDLETGPNTLSLFYTSISRVLLSLTGKLGQKQRSPRRDKVPTKAISTVAPVPISLPAPVQAANLPQVMPIIKSSEEQTPHGIVLGQDKLTFDTMSVGQSQMLKLVCKNTSIQDQTVEFFNPDPPFYNQHHTHTIRAKHFVKLRIIYKPKSPGKHRGFMVIQTPTRHNLVAELTGECVS